MKTLAIALLLSGAMLWAQTTTPQTPPAGTQGQTGAGAAHQGMHHGNMQGMQHMDNMAQQMHAIMMQMRTNLDRMKADIANIKDPAAKAAAQDNYDMWQGMYMHMQMMMQQHMGSQGMASPGMMGGQSGSMTNMPPQPNPNQGTMTPGTTNPSTPTQIPPPQSQTPPPQR